MASFPSTVIALPSLDLKAGEDLEQALANLTLLEHNFSKICSNLDQRLANLKGKLGSINQRIGNSRNKIEVLKNVNEAITIVSPSKFVRSYKNKQDVSFVDSVNSSYVNNQRVSDFDYENNMNMNLKIASDQAYAKRSEINIDEEFKKIIKLTKGTIKPKRELFSGSHAIQQQSMEGLGRIPKKIRYVDSLVVFNSKQNPFQKYQSFDNLMSNSIINIPKKKAAKDKDAWALHEAPQTLTAGDTVGRFTAQGFEFIPEAKELPQLSAPTTLGLAGIVNINSNNADSDMMIPSRGGTVARNVLSDPKILADDNANQIGQSTLAMQRFSIGNANLAQNNMAASNVSNQNQSQGAGNSYSFSPVISQNQAINVQKPVEATTPSNNAQTTKPTPVTTTQPVQQTTPANTQPVDLSKVTSVKELPKATGDRAALLAEINNPNPMAKLKKATPKENGPPLGSKPAAPANSRAALLAEINNPNPMARLKKATPKEDRPPLERKTGGKEEPKLSHMDHLKEQIQRRFQAINEKKKKKKEESSDEEDD